MTLEQLEQAREVLSETALRRVSSDLKELGYRADLVVAIVAALDHFGPMLEALKRAKQRSAYPNIKLVWKLLDDAIAAVEKVRALP